MFVICMLCMPVPEVVGAPLCAATVRDIAKTSATATDSWFVHLDIAPPQNFARFLLGNTRRVLLVIYVSSISIFHFRTILNGFGNNFVYALPTKRFHADQTAFIRQGSPMNQTPIHPRIQRGFADADFSDGLLDRLKVSGSLAQLAKEGRHYIGSLSSLRQSPNCRCDKFRRTPISVGLSLSLFRDDRLLFGRGACSPTSTEGKNVCVLD
jgi:hypothetical protein